MLNFTKKLFPTLVIRVSLISAALVLAVYYFPTIVLGASSFSKKLASMLVYPFEKRSCEKQGGTYSYNASFDKYACQVAGEPYFMKPVIYFYPEREMPVHVKLEYEPGFSVTYPEYENGWSVTAQPSGKLFDHRDGREYSYLYWEGNPDPNADFDLTTGFVVAGEDTAIFLQDKLQEMGLTPQEYNEFIVYWYPRMKHNPYNLIHFASKEEYADKATLEISPTPDSLLRVFMVYKPLTESVHVQPQAFSKFSRQGFSVVEWGGSELK